MAIPQLRNWPSSWMTLMWVNLAKTNQPAEHGQKMTAYGEGQQGERRRPTDNKRIKMLAPVITVGGTLPWQKGEEVHKRFTERWRA